MSTGHSLTLALQGKSKHWLYTFLCTRKEHPGHGSNGRWAGYVTHAAVTFCRNVTAACLSSQMYRAMEALAIRMLNKSPQSSKDVAAAVRLAMTVLWSPVPRTPHSRL